MYPSLFYWYMLVRLCHAFQNPENIGLVGELPRSRTLWLVVIGWIKGRGGVGLGNGWLKKAQGKYFGLRLGEIQGHLGNAGEVLSRCYFEMEIGWG